MTINEFKATFEVSGTDGLWEAVQTEIARERREAVRSNKFTMRDRWDRVSGAMYAMCALYVLTAAGFSIRAAANYNIRQGQIELHDCASGKTLACEAAVEGATGDREAFYLTAYRQSTGKDLPRVYAGAR